MGSVRRRRLLFQTSGGCDLAAEISVRPLNPFTKGVADEAGDLDGAAHVLFRFLERLRDALLVVEDEGLLQQSGFLVEGLEARLDTIMWCNLFRNHC